MAELATPRSATIRELIDRYDGLLVDAFGVLVHSSAALPGARELVDELCERSVPFLVVTNDASKLPETSAAKLQSMGLSIRAEQIVTSGSLIAPYFAEQGLRGARCLVLGPEDSHRYVRDAGAELVEPAVDARYDAVVICDDAGYPFLDTMDVTLTALIRHFDRGERPHLILPNPDLIYPKGDRAFGFTSGAAALLIETVLARRYPEAAPRFVRLGKPYATIFRESMRRLGTIRVVMIGDSIETDIAGARAAGIDAALYAGTSTVTRTRGTVGTESAPTYLLESLVS